MNEKQIAELIYIGLFLLICLGAVGLLAYCLFPPEKKSNRPRGGTMTDL